MKRRGTIPHLPITAALFVGREADQAAIAQRLEDGRLVTIVGPGGMGKTQLAVRFAQMRAAALSSHGGGGVWFCDLSEARDAQDIASHVAASLGIKLAADGQEPAVLERLGRALARRGRILVILDNFDRLASEAQATVATWLRLAPSARFLVTSRVPLDLPGEQRWVLAPLTRDEAIDLFGHRARLVRPDFDLDTQREVVGQIVEAIDCLPLAIELAATRSAVLSTMQLRERLDNHSVILTSPSPGRAGKHGSMRQTVLDSVALLPASASRLFGACSLMRNGFTLEAAEGTFADFVGASILDTLETLVRTSLLRVDHEHRVARYGFFETIRDVAEELGTEAASNTTLLRSYARFYAALAERAGDGWELAADFENLVHAHKVAVELATGDPAQATLALKIAIGLQPMLSMRGLSAVCVRLFEVLERVGDSADPSLAARGHLTRGFAHRELGDASVARVDFERGLALARRAGNGVLAAVALTRLGETSDVAGDTESARARYDEALSILTTAPDDRPRRVSEAEAYLRLGHALRREGELARAREAIARSIERYRVLEDDEGHAWGLYELAIVDMFANAHAAAFEHFDEGRRVAQRGGIRVVTGALETARGCLLQDLGKTGEALEHHARAARVFHEVGSRYREASALYYLATAYLERGDASECMSMLERARSRLVDVGAARYDALIAGCRASALASRGEPGDQAAALQAMADAERAASLVRNEPALACNVRIHRLHVDLRATRADNSAADAANATAIQAARELVATSPSDDSRFALRVLLAAASPEQQPADDYALLRVWVGGQAFQPPGAAERVTLPQRSPLRRIVERLAQRRIEAPGELVTLEDLIRAGWPSERIGADAAVNRAYVALASLRKMGLRDVLVRGAGGYMLSQAVRVRFVAD